MIKDLLTKHNIRHGIELDQYDIDEFVKELDAHFNKKVKMVMFTMAMRPYVDVVKVDNNRAISKALQELKDGNYDI